MATLEFGAPIATLDNIYTRQVPDYMDSSPDISIGSLVRARRLALRLTLEQVAVLAGCTKSYLSGIENDRRGTTPSEGILRKIEAALGFVQGELVEIAEWRSTPPSIKKHISELQSRESATRKLIRLLSRASAAESDPARSSDLTPHDKPASLDDLFRTGDLKRLIDAIAPSPTIPAPSTDATDSSGAPMPLRSLLPVQIPLINSVAAGYPAEFTDLGYPARVADDYVQAPNIHDPDAFAARVVGDSMLPEYRQGDIVIFSPATPVKSGMDCFVRLEPDHESTFKRVYFEPGTDGDSNALIRLQPLNSAFAPRILPREQVAGLYALAAIFRMV